jgi:hypothetical protein
VWGRGAGWWRGRTGRDRRGPSERARGGFARRARLGCHVRDSSAGMACQRLVRLGRKAGRPCRGTVRASCLAWRRPAGIAGVGGMRQGRNGWAVKGRLRRRGLPQRDRLGWLGGRGFARLAVYAGGGSERKRRLGRLGGLGQGRFGQGRQRLDRLSRIGHAGHGRLCADGRQVKRGLGAKGSQGGTGNVVDGLLWNIAADKARAGWSDAVCLGGRGCLGRNGSGRRDR